jgi:hypothetical protein
VSRRTGSRTLDLRVEDYRHARARGATHEDACDFAPLLPREVDELIALGILEVPEAGTEHPPREAVARCSAVERRRFSELLRAGHGESRSPRVNS